MGGGGGGSCQLFFPSLYSFLSPSPPLSSLIDLSKAPVLSDPLLFFFSFFPKHLFPSTGCFIRAAKSPIGDNVEPKWRDLSWEMRAAFRFTSLHPFWKCVCRSTRCDAAFLTSEL